MALGAFRDMAGRFTVLVAGGPEHNTVNRLMDGWAGFRWEGTGTLSFWTLAVG